MKNLIQQPILMKRNIRMFDLYVLILFKYIISYRNVPVRQMSAAELLEIEKKVQEIERGTRKEDVDEDDAG